MFESCTRFSNPSSKIAALQSRLERQFKRAFHNLEAPTHYPLYFCKAAENLDSMVLCVHTKTSKTRQIKTI